MKALRYFFWRNYQLNLQQRAMIPWLRPLLLTTLFLSFNLNLIVSIGYMSVQAKAAVIRPQSAASAFMLALAILVVFYYRWVHTDQYLRFCAEFAKETSAQRKRRSWYLFVWPLLSITGVVVVGRFAFLASKGQ